MEKKKAGFSESIRVIFRTMRVIFRMDPRNIPAFAGGRLVKTVQPFAALFFSARILDLLSYGAERRAVVYWILGAVLCNYGLYLLERFLACASSVEGITLYWQLYQEMSRVMMKADYKELEGQEIRQAMERIERSTNMFWYGPWEIPGVLMSVVEGLAATVSALMLAWPVFLPSKGGGFSWALPVMLAVIAVSVWYSLGSEKKLYRMKEESLDTLASQFRVSDYLKRYIDTDKGAKDVRLYRQEGMILPCYQENNRAIEQLSRRRSRLEAQTFGVRGALAELVSCLAYLIVGAGAIAGTYGVGGVVQYVGAVTKLSEGIRGLIYSFEHIRMQAPHCQEYLDFIGEGKDPRAWRHEEDGAVGGTEALDFADAASSLTLEFDHVSFRYPGTQTDALHDVSFRIRHGVHLAVVGRNGSGKTTMIKLLCRLYDPSEGRILLNGRDIRTIPREEYWKLFAVVFQDFYSFNVTVGENVAGFCDWDEARCLSCIEQAGLGGWLRKQPKGLNQPVGDLEEDSVKISGGESQKLAIARALYKDAPFIILDEPTAALDPISEAEIYSRFRSITEQKGAIYISHRLSSCRFCDEILVFDGGRLIQEGTHEALTADKRGKYSELWTAQAQYYA